MPSRRLVFSDLSRNHALRNAIGEWQQFGRVAGAAAGQSTTAEEQVVDDSRLPVVLSPGNPLELHITHGDQDKANIFMLTIEAPLRDCRAPVDICAVVDVSGSMGGDAGIVNAQGVKESHGFSLLDIVKHAVRTVMCVLGPQDRFSLVAFTDTATTLFPLMNMTAANKQRANAALDSLKPEDSTNIWDGLEHAFKVFQGQPRNPNRVSAVMLLTDGVPNCGPSIGALASLRNWKSKNGGTLPCSVYTFGFGYDLESALLRDIAAEGDGVYGFIPDASFVGTCFVNSICNLLSVIAMDVMITLDGRSVKRVIGFPDCRVNATSHFVRLGSIKVGQSQDIIVELETPVRASSVHIEVAFTHVGLGFQRRVINESVFPVNPYPSTEFLMQFFRAKCVDLIDEVLLTLQFNKKKATTMVESFAEVLGSSVIRRDDRVLGLLQDVSGQILEAISTPAATKRWGKHYLLALANAHLRQQCTNFKDPGVQFYGGHFFRSLREQADVIFCTLPAPRPQNFSRPPVVHLGYSASVSSTSSSSPTLTRRNRSPSPPPVNMSSYYDNSNPCFAGAGRVLLASGTTVRVDEVRKGHVVAGVCGMPPAEVVCVVKTACTAGRSALVTLSPSGLQLTPYHPVLINGAWEFPCSLSTPQVLPCPFVYSFVLQSGHGVSINGVTCVTLGHGCTDSAVVTHPYFGSATVLQDLASMPGWTSGLIQFAPNCMIRRDHLLCGFNREKLVQPVC